jgi:heat shock protein HtpX
MAKHKPAASLAGRAVLAIVLLLGFYALGIAVAGVLLYVVYAEIWIVRRINLQFTFFAVVGAGIILWSLVPRVDRFTPPGPRLTASEQPRLFDLIRRIAAATRQAMPREVYLVPDVNAWVAQRGGLMGLGSRRVMGLGLPLLGRLTIAQLAGVLAHEFGHFYGGDTALGPWIYKTRAAIGRTLVNLAHHSRTLMGPFEWYGKLFLRVTLAISRAQEYGADALAARVTGSAPLITGLTAIHASGAAFDSYWHQEYVPALQGGFRPPLQEGFHAFVASDVVVRAMEDVIQEELADSRSNPYDTHPPLPDRIAALGQETVVAEWANPALAMTLLDDPGALEQRLIDSLVGDEHAAKLQAVSWQDLPRLLWVPAWKGAAGEHAERLKGVTPSRLSDLPTEPAGLAVALRLAADPEAATPEHAVEANVIFGAALATALLSRGWDFTAGPGEPVRFRNGSEEIQPFDTWQQIVDGRLSGADWRAQCERAGIAGLDLGA